MNTVYDLVDPVELTGFVRSIGVPTFGLSAWLPDVAIEDLKYLWEQGIVGDLDAAMFRTWDTPSQRGSRPGYATVEGKLAPISKMMELSEEETIRARRLLGVSQVNIDSALVKQIFNDVRRLARSVYARLEIAKRDAIFTGVVTIAENGLAMSVDQNYASSNFVDLGAYTPGANKYLTDTSADALGILEAIIEDYQTQSNGVLPGAILAPRRLRSLLRSNGVVISQTVGMSGSGLTEVTKSQLETQLNGYDVPPIYVNETSVPVAGTAQRIVPVNQFALLPAPSAPNPATAPTTETLDPDDDGLASALGRCFWGPTAESIAAVEATQIATDLAPGIYSNTLQNDHPVSTATNVVAVAFPVIGQPTEVKIVKFAAS